MLVTSILVVVRLGGKEMTPIILGNINFTFLAFGGTVALALVTPCLLVTRSLSS